MEKNYRHEYKYLISKEAAALLKLRLPHIMKLDPHVEKTGWYTIRSLYFDDLQYGAFYDKVSGVDPRTKYRIRCYDYKYSLFRLEKKEKKGHLTRKTGQTLTAADVVNGYPAADLIKILRDYGEEKFAPRIVSAIVEAREKAPIATTLELAELIKGAIPAKFREGGHHPAKKSFQAIRIEVNGELKIIEPTLRALVNLLNPGGRIAVITFHSLEDRIVKQTFASLTKSCTCPPDFPVCICGGKPLVTLPERKPILPSETELEENPRSRSAKLRVAEKI